MDELGRGADNTSPSACFHSPAAPGGRTIAHIPTVEVAPEHVESLRILIDEYRWLRAESGIPEPDPDAATEMLSNVEALSDALDGVASPIVRTGPQPPGGSP